MTIDLIATTVAAAKAALVPPALLLAICSAETDWKPRLNPDDGGSASHGLCQIKLTTAQMFDRHATPAKLRDPAYNARMAALYLRYQLGRYPNNPKCVISAYNAGSCLRNPRGRILNRSHVNKVMERLIDYEKLVRERYFVSSGPKLPITTNSGGSVPHQGLRLEAVSTNWASSQYGGACTNGAERLP